MGIRIPMNPQNAHVSKGPQKAFFVPGIFDRNQEETDFDHIVSTQNKTTVELKKQEGDEASLHIKEFCHKVQFTKESPDSHNHHTHHDTYRQEHPLLLTEIFFGRSSHLHSIH
jgi:hypothetical protein